MALPTKFTFYKLNDQYLEISGLKNGLTGAYINDATVTATLKDEAGANVTGFTNITLSYVSSSDGIYRGQIQETFNPTAQSGYVLNLDIVQGSNVAHLEVSATVKVRKS